MEQVDLISLAHRKNEAYRLLVEKRARMYVPSSLAKSTADDRKIALDHATRAEQEAYDNLADELMVRLEILRHE